MFIEMLIALHCGLQLVSFTHLHQSFSVYATVVHEPHVATNWMQHPIALLLLLGWLLASFATATHGNNAAVAFKTMKNSLFMLMLQYHKCSIVTLLLFLTNS